MFGFIFTLLLFIFVCLVSLVIFKSTLDEKEKSKSLIIIGSLLGLIMIVNDLKSQNNADISLIKYGTEQVERNFYSYKLNTDFYVYKDLPPDDNYQTIIEQQFHSTLPHTMNSSFYYFIQGKEQSGINSHFAQYAYQTTSSSIPILSLNLTNEIQSEQDLQRFLKVPVLESFESVAKKFQKNSLEPLIIVFNYHQNYDLQNLLCEFLLKLHTQYNVRVILLGDLTSRSSLTSYLVIKKLYSGQTKENYLKYATTKISKLLQNEVDRLDQFKFDQLNVIQNLNYGLIYKYVKNIESYGNFQTFIDRQQQIQKFICLQNEKMNKLTSILQTKKFSDKIVSYQQSQIPLSLFKQEGLFDEIKLAERMGWISLKDGLVRIEEEILLKC